MIQQVFPNLYSEDESSEQVVNFLRSTPFEDIVSKSEMFNTYYITGIPWLPIVDDFSKRPFIPKDFNTLFSEGNYNKVRNIMLIFMSHLGYLCFFIFQGTNNDWWN